MCYKEFSKENETKEIVQQVVAPEKKDIIIPETKKEENTTEDIKSEEAKKEEEKKEEVQETKPEKPKQVNIHACWKCEKKVGYLGFTCRCGYTFCNSHRHFNDHGCDFDYKSLERDRLKKALPIINTCPTT